VPVVGLGLIDTGAEITGVDLPAIQQLGIPSIRQINVGAATGQQMTTVHPVSFAFPGGFPEIQFNSVIACDLQGQGIIALIGRDVLRHMLFVYNGITGTYSFAM